MFFLDITDFLLPFCNTFSDIAHAKMNDSLVAEHLNGEGRSLADVTVVAINKICIHDPCLDKIRENRWIRTLGTSYPSGMNLRVDFLGDLLRICFASIRQQGLEVYLKNV